MRTAIITNENGTLKCVTATGENVAGEIKDFILKRALQKGEPLMVEKPTGWMMAKTAQLSENRIAELTNELENIMKETKRKETMENEAVSNEQTAVLNLIHNSYDKKPEKLVMSELKWKYMVRSVVRAKNIMMTGAAGTGKTYTAQQVAKGMERPFFYFNLGATQDPRATLIGNTHFQDGKGTYFNESLFVKALQTEDAVILLDELSRANPEAWNILMTVLDEGQRYLRLDEQEGAPTIPVAKGVCFIATANIGNEYTSTRVMDRALMDRFTIIEVEAMDKDQEKGLLLSQFNINEAVANAIAEIADATRKELNTEAPRIGSAISTRSTIEMASLIYDGFTLEEAAEVAVYPFFDPEGGVDSERTFVKQIVQKYVGIENVDTEQDTDDLFNLTDDTY